MIAASQLQLSREGVLTLRDSHGLSPEAFRLWERIKDLRRYWAEGISVGRVAAIGIANLNVARSETSWANWDGYGARPIDTGAYEMAKRFLCTLPTMTPTPAIGVDPDGEVSMDWTFSRTKLLSISVGATGRVSYAARIGVDKVRGTEWIVDAVPTAVLDVLSRVMRA
jgi:hypothetical protein